MAESVELDDLVEHWTVFDDERDLISGKRGSTRLGFALLLKFYGRWGRFPTGAAELAWDAVAFVAKQVQVDAVELGAYEWSGSTIAYHRSQIRQHFGFRECSVADADALIQWLTVTVCERERRAGQVRDELLNRCRFERIEPPSVARAERIIRSALHQAELSLTGRIAGRISAQTAQRLCELVAVDTASEDGAEIGYPLTLIKSVPGNVSPR